MKYEIFTLKNIPGSPKEEEENKKAKYQNP